MNNKDIFKCLCCGMLKEHIKDASEENIAICKDCNENEADI